jgi:hypothetical protein
VQLTPCSDAIVTHRGDACLHGVVLAISGSPFSHKIDYHWRIAAATVRAVQTQSLINPALDEAAAANEGSTDCSYNS